MNRLVREQYVARMRKQLADQKAQIQKLNARARAATRELKAKMAQDLKKVRARLRVVEEKLKKSVH